MADGNYVKFFRSLLTHPLWMAEPFTKGQAFADLFASANFKDGKVLCGNEVIVILRGQLYTSELKLAERWKWSRNKVRAYLKLLKSMEMATSQGTTKGTIITIEKYEEYQSEASAKGTAVETSQGTAQGQRKNIKETTQGTQSKNDKNDKKKKNEKKDKNIYGEFANVRLTDEEYQKLIERFPSDYMERIDRLSVYVESTGKKYSSHYATILNWSKKDRPKAAPSSNPFLDESL